MKYAKLALFTGCVVAAFAGFSSAASAQYYYSRTPVLSVSLQSGGNAQISVSNADPNSQITLYRRQTTQLWTVINNFGMTDSNGYFSSTQNLGSDGSNNPVEQYVVVNGQQSATVKTYLYNYNYDYNYNYNYNNCYSYPCVGGISFSPSNPNLYVGQSLTVTISAPYLYNGSYYISNNSNSSVVSASLSGNNLYLYGQSAGSATITVCQSSASACGSLYVNVGGGSGYGNLWFSPSNPNLYVGQSLAVSINSGVNTNNYNYGSNVYYISNNSNSSVVSANISGTVLNLYGLQNGSATINVCHSSLNFCASLYVTVGGGGSTGSLYVSPSSLNLSAGQSANATIYGSNTSLGSYYISSNSNYNAATASISGSTVYVTAGNGGNTTFTICQYNNNAGCASLYVTVGGGSGYGNVWISPSTINMTAGQTTSAYIYSSSNYSGSYYISSNSNSFVASASISGSRLDITAINSGQTNFNVCQSSYSGNCANLPVTVSGYGGSGTVTFSQNYLNLTAGQSATVTVYGNGGYYISSNSNSSAVSASLSSNVINLYAYNSGSSAIVVCQNNPYGCGTLSVNVSGGGNYGGTLTFNSATLPNMVLGQYYNYQLQVSGGSPPYNFQLTSGQLPQGLYLTSGGMLYGTPQNSAYSTFSIRASDNYGRSASANFTIGGGGVLGNSTYPSGQLIKEDGTVYLVYRGRKSGFSSASVFTAFGFKFSNVLNVGYSSLPGSGYIINNSNTSHPWGAWILSGQTVYFVHEQGLIPVPSWEILTNNRGQSSFIVPANSYDFQRPVLSPMTMNDSRLF